MTTAQTNHCSQLSAEYLRKAHLHLAEDDLKQASEKAWGAAATAVKAIAESRGLEHSRHGDLWRTVRLAVRETGDREFRVAFGLAESLHQLLRSLAGTRGCRGLPRRGRAASRQTRSSDVTRPPIPSFPRFDAGIPLDCKTLIATALRPRGRAGTSIQRPASCWPESRWPSASIWRSGRTRCCPCGSS